MNHAEVIAKINEVLDSHDATDQEKAELAQPLMRAVRSRQIMYGPEQAAADATTMVTNSLNQRRREEHYRNLNAELRAKREAPPEPEER